MNTTTENKLATVAGKQGQREPKQARETPDPWWWVERSVWTDRMLQRLEQSQEQTVWYSLWDKVWAERNLVQACLEVVRNEGSAGVDGQSVERFEREMRSEIGQLQNELRTGRYQPLPVKRVWIEKLGSSEKRPLGVPAVRDRVVQAALRHVLEPILERDFAEHSYGFRPGRSTQDALRRVEQLLKEGYTWVVDADLKGYFDSIPHDKLIEAVSRRIADGRVLDLIQAYLKAGMMERGKDWQPTTQGTPQGAVLSPLLSNLYLNPLDHRMAQQGKEMVRYADDFVVFCRTQAQADEALEQIAKWTREVGLTLHPTKTRLVNAAEAGGFDFLGYHFERYRDGSGKKWPRKKSLMKLRQSIRMKTSRMRSESIGTIIAEINPTLKGWFAYFKHSIPGALAEVDGWVRRRLRSIQRFRNGGAGISKGWENRVLTIQWFAERGLFSLTEARARCVQSHR